MLKEIRINLDQIKEADYNLTKVLYLEGAPFIESKGTLGLNTQIVKNSWIRFDYETDEIVYNWEEYPC